MSDKRIYNLGTASDTTGQYLPIDKSGNAEAEKILVSDLPISTATQAALDAKQNSLGYTAENSANKSTDVNTDQASNTKFPSVKAVYDWAVGLFVAKNSAITGATKAKITYDAKGLVTAGADLEASDLPTGIDAAKIADGTVSNAEFQYLNGVTSAIQTQLDTKIDTVNSAGLGETLISSLSGDTLALKSLIAGTNISFTVEGNTITISASGGGGTPSGVAGSVQFSDGSAFASDNTNLFWDDTNNRFGLGVNSSLLSRLHVVGAGATSGSKSVVVQDSNKTNQHFYIQDDGDWGNINSTANALQINFSPVANKWLKFTRQSQEVIIGSGNTGNSSVGTVTNVSFSILSNNQNRITIAATGEVIVGSGTSVDAGAMLEVKSTTKGLKFPNTVTASMVSPSAGVVFWDTALLKLRVYNGSAWETITSS